MSVTCKNPINKIPESVTVKMRSVTTNHSIPITNIHAQQLKQEVENKMAVCTSTIYHLTAKDKGFLLQSLNMKFAMGANKIFIYGSLQNNPEIDELLSQLAGPSIQMMDWILPDVIQPGIYLNAEKDMNNCARYNAQPLQYWDCQYRNMYLYKYLAVIDLDEFVYPMATTMNTVAMLDDMSKRKKNQVASFMFYQYQSCYVHKVFHGVQLRQWGRRAFLRTSPWVTIKSIHKPEMVTYIQVHIPRDPLNQTYSLFVSPLEGNLFHFRQKCSTSELEELKEMSPESRARDDVINMYFNRTVNILKSIKII